MRYLSILMFCFLFSFVAAQSEKIFEIDHMIPSKAFGDERKITIYLPPNFYEEPQEKFAVTYVLDGHYDPFIDLGVKIIEYGTYNYKNIPTIVVGIHAKNRGWEFSALLPNEKKKDQSYQGGRAPELQLHFKNEVFPVVENFSLIPDLKDRLLPFRTLIGHSSGGGFVLYSLFSEEKDLFDAYIAISPGLRPGENNILADAKALLDKKEPLNKFLFCSTGTVSTREDIFSAGLDQIDSLLNEYPNNGLIYKRRSVEGAGHFSLVAPSFSMGMVEMTRAYRVDEYLFEKFANNEALSMEEQIEDFYRSRKETLGFIEIPKEGYISNIAMQMFERNLPDRALETINWALKYYPNKVRLYKRKGFLLKEMKKTEEAITVFNKGIAILEKQKGDVSAERYKDDLDYFNRKLKQIAEMED